MAGLIHFQTRFPKSLTRSSTVLFASDWAHYQLHHPDSQVKIEPLKKIFRTSPRRPTRFFGAHWDLSGSSKRYGVPPSGGPDRLKPGLQTRDSWSASASLRPCIGTLNRSKTPSNTLRAPSPSLEEKDELLNLFAIESKG